MGHVGQGHPDFDFGEARIICTEKNTFDDPPYISESHGTTELGPLIIRQVAQSSSLSFMTMIPESLFMVRMLSLERRSVPRAEVDGAGGPDLSREAAKRLGDDGDGTLIEGDLGGSGRTPRSRSSDEKMKETKD